ncbi:hypothetical protein [Streptacidiphilus monticola]|uniref:Copper chaperone PCu(A)C n=1 Tax=Streptacidiphilus monticola TaxID=2161674 RepID=A0ABW1FZ78_9ACTN
MRRVLLPALVLATLSVVAGCAGNSVERAAPGAVTSSVRTSADGTDLSVRGRNVDLRLTQVAVRLGPSGPRLDLTVDNEGPVTEHLALASVDGTQATLHGGATADTGLSPAGVRIAPAAKVAFGTANAPSATLPTTATLKAGEDVPVMLQFGIAGMIRLQVPVLAR